MKTNPKINGCDFQRAEMWFFVDIPPTHIGNRKETEAQKSQSVCRLRGLYTSRLMVLKHHAILAMELPQDFSFEKNV